MTDGELVKIAARIYRHNEAILTLLELAQSHTYGGCFKKSLQDEGIGYLSVDIASVAHGCLRESDNWEWVDGGTLRWNR